MNILIIIAIAFVLNNSPEIMYRCIFFVYIICIDIPFTGETYLSKVQNLDIEDAMENFESSNVYQIEAIKNSLNNSFSLIHGPPGK